MVHRLLDANMTQSDEPLAEVSSLLATLAEGWAGIRQPAEPETVEANLWTAPEAVAACASQAWTL
jgi:flagellin-specific chaperone FliS